MAATVLKFCYGSTREMNWQPATFETDSRTIGLIQAYIISSSVKALHDNSPA